MKYAFGAILVFIMLFGCVSQSYEQKVDVDGSSVITTTMDFSKVPAYGIQAGKTEVEAEELVKNALGSVCAEVQKSDKSITCSIEESKLAMKRQFTPNEGYYSFEVKEGIPYKTYRVIVYKIPSEKFGKAIYPVIQQNANELLNSPFSGTPVILDLRKKKENAVLGAGLVDLVAFRYNYSVEMPGEVISAYYGENTGQVSGNKASFDLVQVLQKSEPLVVESRELNILWMGLIVGAVAILVLGFMFFGKEKKE